MKKIIITFLVLLVLIVPLTYFAKKMSIKNKYNDYAITNKDTDLYNNNKKIGSISKNTYLELEKTNNKYFKIKNTDLYILYKDINKTEKQEIIEKDYYVEIGKKIKTSNPTKLYQNENALVINKELEFDVIKQDDTYYYVNLGTQQYKIDRKEIKEENEKNIEGIANYISILNYNNIKDECTNDECIKKENVIEQLNYLKENNYYTITKDDLNLWVNNQINLKEKAILITSNDETLKEINKEYNFNIEQDNDSFENTNTKCEKRNTNLPRYNIINKTTLDTFKQILDGETVSYKELPIKQNHTLKNENENATEIAVLNYHFFYDPEIGESCPDGNCKKVQDFENELLFLKQNNYKTLTMEEFKKWMYNEIELPARSVLITIDDGAMGTGAHNGNKLIPLLEKYQSHATLFLITGWWAKENYSSPYLDIESHTFDMHEGNICEGQPRGSKLLCSTKEQVKEDLSKSAEITGSKNAFCFPMYVYNETTLEVLKELDFKLAFVGGNKKATRSDNKYEIPRYVILSDITLEGFKKMVN